MQNTVKYIENHMEIIAKNLKELQRCTVQDVIHAKFTCLRQKTAVCLHFRKMSADLDQPLSCNMDMARVPL